MNMSSQRRTLKPDHQPRSPGLRRPEGFRCANYETPHRGLRVGVRICHASGHTISKLDKQAPSYQADDGRRSDEGGFR